MTKKLEKCNKFTVPILTLESQQTCVITIKTTTFITRVYKDCQDSVNCGSSINN